MTPISRLLHDNLGLGSEIQTKLLWSLLIFLVLGAIRFFILKLVWRLTDEPKTRYIWKPIIGKTGRKLTL